MDLGMLIAVGFHWHRVDLHGWDAHMLYLMYARMSRGESLAECANRPLLF